MCRAKNPLMVLLLMPLAAGTCRAADADEKAAPATLPNTAAAPVPGYAHAVAPGYVPAYPGAYGPRVFPGHGEAPVVMAPNPAALPPVQAGYPYLNAPLYPCPQPNVPVQVGSTLITNQAFAPQEMLYPHDYQAMYPPFYYKVKGHWLTTPFGVKSDERWELLGTKVKVKYRSAIPFWAGYSVPHRDHFDWDKNWSNPGSVGAHHGSWHNHH